MRPDDLQALLRMPGFKPFRLYLSTGLTYEIRHPETVVVGRSIAWLHFPPKEFPIPVGERRVFITLVHIVSGEFIDGGSAPQTNGAIGA